MNRIRAARVDSPVLTTATLGHGATVTKKQLRICLSGTVFEAEVRDGSGERRADGVEFPAKRSHWFAKAHSPEYPRAKHRPAPCRAQTCWWDGLGRLAGLNAIWR